MDFIDQLPLSRSFDAILVVVCRLTKMALFIPTTTTVTSEGLALLYLQHVFSKHRVPQDIISDCGSKFTSTFWRSLSKVLGIQQNLSTAYHPESDGQTEHVNQIIEMYLRFYIN
jgi:archaellum biogenesis protein FlaJ (TadC family)